MVSYNWFQFKDTGYNLTHLPYNTHLINETPTKLFYVSADNIKEIWKYTIASGTDELLTTCTYDVEAMYYDRTNGFIYYCGINDTEAPVKDKVYCYRIDLSDDSIDALGYGDMSLSDGSEVLSHADILVTSNGVYMIFDFLFGGVYGGYYCKWDGDVSTDENWVVQSFISMAATGVMRYGIVIGQDFYIPFEDSTLGKYELVFCDTSVPSCTKKADLGDYSIPIDNLAGICYDGSNLIYVIVNDGGTYKLAIYSISGNSWTLSEEYNVALTLERNCVGTSPSPWEFEKAFHITLPYIYQIQRGYDYLFKLQQLPSTVTISWITDKYMGDTDKNVYELTNYLNNYAKRGSCTYRCYTLPELRMTSSLLLSTDQLIELYQLDGATYTKIFAGKAGLASYDDSTVLYSYSSKNFGWDDLEEAVTYTATAAGIDEVVIAIIAANCDYVWCDTTSVPNIAVNCTVIFNKQKLWDVLYTLAILANGYWWVEANGYLYFRQYSNMVASGDTFNQGTHNMGVPITPRKQLNYYNTWNISGGWNSATNTLFVPTTPTDAAHILLYGKRSWGGRSLFPECRTQASLDALVTAIEAWQGMQTAPDDLECYILGKNYYPIGRKASVQHTKFTQFAVAQDMLIKKSELDFKTHKNKITFSTNIVEMRG